MILRFLSVYEQSYYFDLVIEILELWKVFLIMSSLRKSR